MAKDGATRESSAHQPTCGDGHKCRWDGRAVRLHSCWLLTPCYDLENFISLESTISRGQAERLWYRRIPEEHSIRAARGKCLACSGISFEKNRQTSCSTVNLMLSAMCCLRCSLSCKCRGTSLCTPFGATWHFLTEGSMEQTLLWGRWVSSSTARIYLQDAAAALSRLSITEERKNYMKQLTQVLSTIGQEGARGRLFPFVVASYQADPYFRAWPGGKVRNLVWLVTWYRENMFLYLLL